MKEELNDLKRKKLNELLSPYIEESYQIVEEFKTKMQELQNRVKAVNNIDYPGSVLTFVYGPVNKFGVEGWERKPFDYNDVKSYGFTLDEISFHSMIFSHPSPTK